MYAVCFSLRLRPMVLARWTLRLPASFPPPARRLSGVGGVCMRFRRSVGLKAAGGTLPLSSCRPSSPDALPLLSRCTVAAAAKALGLLRTGMLLAARASGNPGCLGDICAEATLDMLRRLFAPSRALGVSHVSETFGKAGSDFIARILGYGLRLSRRSLTRGLPPRLLLLDRHDRTYSCAAVLLWPITHMLPRGVGPRGGVTMRR